MRKIVSTLVVSVCFSAVSAHATKLSFDPIRASSDKPFVFKDANGKSVSVPVVDASAQRKIVGPLAKVDPRLNPAMARAATIAQERAHAHSKSRCWHYVKEALLAAGAVNSYPKTALAKQAGDELVNNYGFKKLAVRDPYAAPVGAVLVYGGKGAGHVEIRNKTGFASDFRTPTPSKRKLIGVFAKA
ncbi:MAG: hypothetical protein M3R10_00420 [Verrucomicrobiota bacterium]|nr:hypothetical protein [Verrucomicrobiota bacterium]